MLSVQLMEHINIPAPREHPECYVNRRGHHSIQLQAISDAQCKFIHCYAGNVGSVHDARVLRLSEVNDYLNDEHKFPNDCQNASKSIPLELNIVTLRTKWNGGNRGRECLVEPQPNSTYKP
ncbi:hypothetical protein WA026_021747 [Henosepilachna vigintioctopunctata]|uniref:DDE Tnp4 domain-containing protein n=1 Tax=Henosepilachna vigintioctopunctata TaxID=420089 RepID=A0AAW1TXW0_9CUCU